MTRYRTILLAIVLSAVSFALGAVWLQQKAFPYDYLRSFDSLVVLKRGVAGSAMPTSKIETAFFDIEVDSFEVSANTSTRIERGGITAVGNDVLLIAHLGDLFLYQNKAGEKSIRQLDVGASNNYELAMEYAKKNDLRAEAVARYFHYFDLLYLEEPGGNTLVASHLYWHPDEGCFTMRLSQLKLAPDESINTVTKSADDWVPLFDARPCLKLEDKHYLELTGGRLALLDEQNFLLTLGSLDPLGSQSDIALSQDPEADYGKVVRIDRTNGSVEHVSIGHRNLQGLTIDSSGNIWTTEHGPQGGDEINLIQTGANYGFPEVVYGTGYGEKFWRRSERQGFHDGYTEPMLAWLPSVGVSNLIEVRNFMPAWDGDLLVATLKQQTLYRMRYREGRFVVSEPVKVRQRIRDIDQLANGKIVLWTDNGVMSELSPIEPSLNSTATGKNIAGANEMTEYSLLIGSCRSCHSVSPDGHGEVSPNLSGVFGRKIAGTDFDGYSESMKSMSGEWDEATLNAFLEDPRTFAKGTNMVVPGISDGAMRERVIDYLKEI